MKRLPDLGLHETDTAPSTSSVHTLRHTCATSLFRRGLNPKQVSAWLGHHSAAFTLDTYIHVLADDLPDAPKPVFLAELGWNRVGTDAAETGRNVALGAGAETGV